MRNLTPNKLILAGFIGVSLGVLLPLLMVMGYIRTTYFMSFLSYAFSVVGLGVGIMGVVWQRRIDKLKNPHQEHERHFPKR